MREAFTFDDVLIVPKFSEHEELSRKDVNLCVQIGNSILTLPIISANMDTITGPQMAREMNIRGAIGCLHRFYSIEENVAVFHEVLHPPMVSVGIGKNELERAEALFNAGARTIVVDVAHGAQMSVVKQVKALRELFADRCTIIVGNFATGQSVLDFLEHVSGDVDGIKVGIGPGSACTTRIKTGVGYPQLSAIMDVAAHVKATFGGISVIADGGMKKPGDIAKALGGGADLVMLGGMLAGTKETPGERVDERGTPIRDDGFLHKEYKKYRGSASKESYMLQGKDANYRTAEGESFIIPYKGPVSEILQDIEGGLRSAMTYVGARTIKDFQNRCEFVRVSPSTVVENGAHGKGV